jgi:hypothetical protein
MTVIRYFAGAALAAAVAGTVSARGVTYDCALQSNEAFGWISPQILVSVDPARFEAMAYDVYIDAQHGAPIPVTFEPLGNGNYRLRWQLSAVPNGTETIKGSWSVTLDPARQRMRAFANLSGFANRPSGQGNCSVLHSRTLFRDGS